jgi:CheY-like chemotaxis protein
VNFWLLKGHQAAAPEPSTILIADDEEGSRLLLQEWVTRLGHHPVLASDGREALERTRQAAPDLIVLDIMMPEVDGLTVLRKLKADPLLALIPVIVVSALGDQEQILPCMRAGAEDYLVKPFNADLLQARIQASLLRRKRRPAPRMHRDASFSPQAVLTRYPAPVAIPYRRFYRQSDSASRLTMLFNVAEACLRYLFTLAASDFLHCLSAQKDQPALLPEHSAFDFLRRHQQGMSMGHWLAALRALARLLAQRDERIVTEVPIVCEPGEALDVDLLGWLVATRNKSFHPDGLIALAPEECHALIGEARPRLEETLQRLAFLCDYPLGFAQPGLKEDAAPGHYRYWLHPCMGAHVANTAEAYAVEMPARLQADTPFVLSQDGSRLLYLWPFLTQRLAPVTSRHSIYVFEGIPDKRRPFLTEIKTAAIDVRDDWRQVLHPAPAADHGWLLEKLRHLPVSQRVPADLDLSGRLRNRGGGKLSGRQLGSNILFEAIARGGFSTVYAARTLAGQRVAVKVIESFDTREHFARFRQEFERLRRLQHPGIIRCFESGNSLIDGKEYPWYSMEFAVGGDLSDRLKERQAGQGLLPWNDSAWRRDIFAEFQTVVEAVAYLHALDIVHRDIKPSNILILENGTLRLSDFGLVKVLNPLADTIVETSTGAVLGTPYYMAPEQETGGSVDKPADVYALGILLAELASGWSGLKLLPDSKAATGSTLQQQEILGGLPKPLRRIIFRCTDALPEKRYAHGQEVLDALEQSREELIGGA